MRNKLLMGLMLASSLTACQQPGAEDAKNQITNDPNIVLMKKVIPELEQEVSVYYNFNDSTQTITRETYPNSSSSTYSFSRRGMDELKGTEKAELNRIIANRAKVQPK
jgi:hypothetical protein